MVPKPGKFQFAIDRGGTFTDVFARCPDGSTKVLKLLSEDPQHYKDAPTEGIRRILQENYTYKMRIKFNEVTGAGLNQEHLFLKKIELSLIKKQIKELSTFLPNVILSLNQDELSLIHHCVGVLLQGDICGITSLADKYNKTGSGGIYKLTATFNAYIGALIEIIQYYGGDVLKYRGPEFRAIWKVHSDDCLFEVLHEAVVCGLVIIRSLNYFLTEVNVPLSVRISISCGNFCFSVIGQGNIKQGIIIGDAVTHIQSGSKLGVVVSPGAWSHMLQDRYIVDKLEDGHYEVKSVSYKPNEEDKKQYYDVKQIAVSKLIEEHFNHRLLLNAEKTFESHMTDSEITEKFMRLLPPREQIKMALKNWIVDELRPFIIKNVQCQVDEGQPVQYLTEFSKLTILLIRIQTHCYTDSSMTVVLDDIFRDICSICMKAMGLVHQFYMRENITCLVLFGLRGVKHEAENQLALKCAYSIKHTLEAKETIRYVTCGVAHGLVYCGVIGHPHRREYVVIGNPVESMNTLTTDFPGKVICDFATFRSSKLSAFYFQILIQGEREYQDIFEFDEVFEGDTREVTYRPLIGRSAEINYIRNLVFNSKNVNNYYGICIYGNESLGKTAILLDCIRRFKESKGVLVVSIELTAEIRTAYFCISNIYRQIYDNVTLITGPDLSNITNLPMELLQNYDNIYTSDIDIALMKYNILKRFRLITQISNKLTVIFIDNVEYIDIQSYEIIEIILKEGNIRLITSAIYGKKQYWDLQHKMSINEKIKMLELAPLKSSIIPHLACQFVGSNGISESIIKLLSRTCNGYPGYVLICLLRLLNNGCIRLKFLNSEDPEVKKFIFADIDSEIDEVYKYEEPDQIKRTGKQGKILSVLEFTSKFQAKKTEVTLTAISLDLFDSFSTFAQMVIKTSAVLGNLFTRTLLVVALKYPTEANLLPVIQHLFEVEVFECGGRLLYGEHIDADKLCCRCYFEPGFFEIESRKDIPKYAFCKIIHFRNKNIKDVAYNLLPGNQRIELHLLCTEILEYSQHQCPRCMRDPCSAFINFYKFKDVMEYCKNPNNFNYAKNNEQTENIDNIKQIIKSNIREVEEETQSGDNEMEVHWKRRFVGMKFCHCFQILSRVNYDLIYHSKRAAHWPKYAFFTTQYGLLLIFQLDYINAISVLNQAREICLIDAGLPTAPFSETFRKLHVGKIEIHLAKCCLELRMLKAAKNHLAIALRQYNIPAIALESNAYRKLLTRSFLVNSKRIRPTCYKNFIAKYDSGICLAYCAKLFAFEGNWRLSKLTSLYSMHLMKGANPHIPIFFDVYCSAVEIYIFSGDMHTCERLQKYFVRELQTSFAFNFTPYLYGIKVLLNNIFLVCCISGNISEALQLGYRVLDIHLKLYGENVHLSIAGWLVLLLMLNYRVKDCLTATRHFVNSSVAGYRRVDYFGMVLRFFLKTGFYIEPVDYILGFAREYYNANPDDESWESLEFRVLLAIHYIRKNRIAKASEWYVTCPFNRQNIKGMGASKTLLVALEYNIYVFLHYKREKINNLSEQEKEIKKLLALLKENVKIFKIFRPDYLCLLAWYEKIRKRHLVNVDRILHEASKIAEEQGNILYQCYIVQLRNVWTYWTSGFQDQPNKPYVQFLEATNFTLSELAQMMHPLPLD